MFSAESLGERIEQIIDQAPCRYVGHGDPGRIEGFGKPLQVPRVDQARLHELDGGARLVEARNAHLHVQCTKGNAAPHLAETDNAESLVAGLTHGLCLS